MRFTSCLNGDVLLGCTQSVDGDVPLVILVRESSRRTPSALAGTMTRFRYERETADGTGEPAVQRFRWTSQIEDAKYDLPKTVLVDALTRTTYDVDATGATTTDSVLPDPVAATWSLAANGAYSDSTGMVGAVTPRGDLFVGVVVDGKRFAWVFGVPGEQFDLLRN